MTSHPVTGWNEPRLPAQIALKYCLTRLCAVRFKYLLLLLVLESPRFLRKIPHAQEKSLEIAFGVKSWLSMCSIRYSSMSTVVEKNDSTKCCHTCNYTSLKNASIERLGRWSSKYKSTRQCCSGILPMTLCFTQYPSLSFSY